MPAFLLHLSPEKQALKVIHFINPVLKLENQYNLITKSPDNNTTFAHYFL